MSEQTADLVARLRERLRRTMRRITLADLAFGGCVTLGLAAAIWLVSVSVEAGLWLEPTPRTVLFGAVLAALLGLAGYFLARPALRLMGLLPDLSEEDAARRVGARYPEVDDRLVNLLQLAGGKRSGATASTNDALLDRAVARLGGEVQPVPFEEVEDFSRARRASRWAVVPVGALLVFLLAAPGTFLGASGRLLAPATHFQRPAPFALAVAPGDVRLVKGEPLEISVRAEGAARPERLTLFMQPEGEERTEEIELRADSAGVFRHRIAGVRQPLRYRAEAGRVQSAWHGVEVVERPLVRGLQVSLRPPAYTGLKPQRLAPNVGDLAALPGTEVALDVALGGQAVRHAFVRFEDGDEDTLSVEGGSAVGAFTLREAGTYQIVLQSEAGIENERPIAYTKTLLADAPPEIAFLAPGPEATLGEDLQENLRLRMSDDFGFAQLRLYYRLAESNLGEPSEDFAHLDLPLDSPRMLSQEIAHDWLLTRETGLDPVPGDVIEYYAKVWDNNRWAGYQSAETGRQRLRVPSLTEKYEQLDEQQETVEERMRQLEQEREAVAEEFDELKRELRRTQESDWEDARQMERLQEQQQSLEEGVEQLTREMQEAARQMQENSLVSPETEQLYRQLQEVAEEINSPELQEALKKLQEAMQNMDLEQMQEAIQEFEFSEEQYQERLQRTLDLFKQLQTQQKLDEAARRAEELAKQEKRLAEETERLRQEQEEKGEPDESAEEAPENDAAEQDEAGENETSENEAQENSAEQNEADEQQNNASEKNASEQDPSDAEKREQLAQEQERAREAMEELEEKLKELQEQMKDTPSAPQDEMQKLRDEMQQQPLPQQMQENSEQLRQNELNEAQQSQQQMQQRLQDMQQRLQKMKTGMQGQQQQLNMAGLRQALSNTLTLSERQEALRRTTDRLAADSPTLRTQAQEQSRLAEGLRTTSDSLQQLARQIPEMSRAVQKETGQALREMEAATGAMTERTTQQAAGNQKAAMMHLNELALLLSNLLDQMQNQQQGQGQGMSAQQMAQQLQQMAGQQQKLNAQIQQMLNDAQGDRLSTSQQERLGQMAAQQRAIQRQLEELRQNTQGSEAGQKVLGDLGRIAEQMQETIQQLQQGRPDRRTKERQQQILTRLLDAQRSLQTRGRENKRQGQAAEDDHTRSSPTDLAPAEEAERLRRDLLRALESGYAPAYQELIKRYFDLLERQEEQRAPQEQPR